MQVEIIRWQIGQKYHYPNKTQQYELVEVKGNDFVLRFIFKCGHVVTEYVFKDLLPVNKQTQLF